VRVAALLAILAAVAAAALTPHAAAAPAPSPEPSPPPTGEHQFFRLMFDPADFASRIINVIGANPAITQWTVRIGILLAAFLFLWNLYMALIHQSPAMVTDALFRAAIVGTIMANLPFVSTVIVDFHRALSAIGTAVFEALGGQSGFDRALFALQEAMEAALGKVGGNWWQFITGGLSVLFMAVYTAAVFIVFLVFMVIAVAIYNFLLFGSYVMLGVAVLMIPLSLACLASRSTQGFAYEWLQVVLHSSLIAMLTKAVAGIILNFAVASSIENYARQISAAQDVEQLFRAVAGIANLLPVVVMLAIGIFTLLNVQGIASAFVGRVESVAGALAGMYFAARAAAPAARAGAQRLLRWSPTASAAAAGAALAAAPRAVGEAARGALASARYQAHRATEWLAGAAGAAGYGIAERLGFDRTLPSGMSFEQWSAVQEIQERTDRFYAETDVSRVVSQAQADVPPVQMPVGVRHDGQIVVADQPYRTTAVTEPYYEAPRPAAGEQVRLDLGDGGRGAPAGAPQSSGRIEPTEADMPTEPIFQPDWPPEE